MQLKKFHRRVSCRNKNTKEFVVRDMQQNRFSFYFVACCVATVLCTRMKKFHLRTLSQQDKNKLESRLMMNRTEAMQR